ncbi:MAG: HEAT repeat domain-containing protein [Planctomycetota bacterium]
MKSISLMGPLACLFAAAVALPSNARPHPLATGSSTAGKSAAVNAAAENKVLGIHWESSLADALERAKSENRVVFIAVNMDGEAGNDRMVKKVYPDKRIQALAALTVNLGASVNKHEASGECSRLGGVPCKVHQSVEIRVRENIFEGDTTTPVIAPHHVFLGPDGSVLMSVPYEVSVSELEWCFHASMDAVAAAAGDDAQPVKRPKKSTGARAPRRLLLGSVTKLTAASLAPMTEAEAKEFIRLANKGEYGDDYALQMERLAAADLPGAIDFVKSTLSLGARSGQVYPATLELFRTIGVRSPASYAEVCMDYCSGVPEEIQHEAIVALEQIGSPEALSVLQKAFRKAKSPLIKKSLVRAIGASGRGDKKARVALLKASKDKKAPLLRANALIALGWLDSHEDVAERLRQGLLPEEFGVGLKIKIEDITENERTAAAVAMGISRDKAWLPLLEKAARSAGSTTAVKTAITAAVETIQTGRLTPLGPSLKKAGSDEIPRDRLFAQAP